MVAGGSVVAHDFVKAKASTWSGLCIVHASTWSGL